MASVTNIEDFFALNGRIQCVVHLSGPYDAIKDVSDQLVKRAKSLQGEMEGEMVRIYERGPELSTPDYLRENDFFIAADLRFWGSEGREAFMRGAEVLTRKSLSREVIMGFARAGDHYVLSK